MITADQKQERPFLCLKSSGSFADCSHCLMPSCIQAGRNLPADFQDSDGVITGKTEDAKTEHTGGPSDENDGLENQTDISLDPLEDLSSENRSTVYKIQTSPAAGQKRSVQDTVENQLLVALHARTLKKRKLGEVHESGWRVCRRLRVATAKKQLMLSSSSEFPTALAVVQGLGSPPFLLYSCVGFDRLHVMDLGLGRQLPNMAYSVFGKSAYNRNILTKSTLVRIANQRMSDLPRSARLKRISAFRSDNLKYKLECLGRYDENFSRSIGFPSLGSSRILTRSGRTFASGSSP